MTGRNNGGTGRTGSHGFGSGLFGGGESKVSSWAAPAWSSFQGLTNTVFGAISGPDGADSAGSSANMRTGGYKTASRTTSGLWGKSGTSQRQGTSSAWGPEPPSTDPARKPRLDDVAAGSLAKREAALKAAKTASVLESYEGVNGGLDVSGRFKKRRSDEDLRGNTNTGQTDESDEHLVYIHHVQKSDTYAGIVLRYRCQEDAFRKANGLWSRDNHYIQMRKWLALPVDACEIRGRPCEAPSYFNSRQVDLLAPTPKSEQDNPYDSFGNSNGKVSGQQQPPRSAAEDDRPWTHVKWVTIESFTKPVEIARVPRKALGYFPPRRKKSLSSNLSTPRGSLDVPNLALASEPADNQRFHSSPASPSTRQRRSSLLGSSRSVGGDSNTDNNPTNRPAWMRRPGGVGTLHSSNARAAPGPERDYFNTWTKKVIPSFSIENMPSMSVMGAESARFGFRETEDAGIVESPFEDGRDVQSLSRGGAESGTGLDKAAATVETWLRGAFAKLPPGTPVLGPRGGGRRDGGLGENDLIELTDTNSDDGKGVGSGLGDLLDTGLLGSGVFGSSSRSDAGADGLRGRGTGRGSSVGIGKGKKAD